MNKVRKYVTVYGCFLYRFLMYAWHRPSSYALLGYQIHIKFKIPFRACHYFAIIYLKEFTNMAVLYNIRKMTN